VGHWLNFDKLKLYNNGCMQARRGTARHLTSRMDHMTLCGKFDHSMRYIGLLGVPAHSGAPHYKHLDNAERTMLLANCKTCIAEYAAKVLLLDTTPAD
jgi:hypothetical protein